MLLFIAMVGSVSAQQVNVDSYEKIVVRYETPQLTITSRLLAGQEMPLLSIEGYSLGGQVGAPALPMLPGTLVVPFCDNMVVEVANAVYDTLDAPGRALWPLQMPRSKSATADPEPRFDSALYATDAFWSMPLASVKPIGTSRDRNLAILTFSPVQVNPVAGKIVVCRSADVTVRFENPDVERTLDIYQRFHSPAFTAPQTLNALHTAKTIGDHSPLRMVVVAGNVTGINGNGTLQRYVDWKRKQGMLVDVFYTGNITAQAIADSIINMYNHATTDNPAPTFVLLLGDHQQLNAFRTKLTTSNSIMSSVVSSGEDYHYTDHYFSTITSDNLPDLYIGRLSATDTTTLSGMLKKTMLYQQYAFPNDAYLGKAALVSGVDYGYVGDNGYEYSDPTMDYIARFYANADNGYTEVNYYKNNTSFAPTGVTVTGSSQANGTRYALINKYNQGMGLINYSAHGLANAWHEPSFTNNHANAMTNTNKPSFVIGNCCLSSKFYNTTCLGEAMTRRGENAGAVTYIGGVNLTYWEQDFHWTVGVRNNITNNMNTNYNALKLGAYDQLFHTHNEARDKRAVTAAAMLQAGNMAVNSTANNGGWYSDMTDYYWEIYELLGDPSILPWLGQAEDLPFSSSQQQQCLNITTAPYAYVALIDSTDLTLLSAGFANQSGTLCLNIPENVETGAFISVTSAGHKPFFQGFTKSHVGIGSVASADITLTPNPAADRCIVSAEGLRQVELLDITGRLLSTATTQADSHTLHVSDLHPGVYLLRIHSQAGIAVKKLIVSK